jgi:uroporphyrinogen-III synthase
VRVWITRTQPEADATAARVRALGHSALVAPVLTVEHLTVVPDLGGVTALAFSSRHGVNAFAASTTNRDLPVFVTGLATARAATAAGFPHVRSADGDGAALARLIGEASVPGREMILHPAALEPAFDLAAALRAVDLEAQSYAAYRSVPALPDDWLAALKPAQAPDAVLVHSAKGAEQVARLLRAAPRLSPAAFAISASAALSLAGAGLAGLYVSEQPTEASLLQRLGPATGRTAS